MTATERPVLAAVRNHVGHLTLNRPAGLNAVTLEMVRLLHQQLSAWAADPQIHAVVLRANGEKPSAPAVTSVRCTTASSAATPSTKPSSRRNTPSTSTSMPTRNHCWH